MYKQRPNPRVILCVGVAVMLASCAAVGSDADLQRQTVRTETTAATITPKPSAALSDPSVTTTRSASEYYHDLERCRASTAATMGAAGPNDNVAALKRALQDDPGGKTVTAAYLPTDRAVVRDRAVKACLSKKGYTVN